MMQTALDLWRGLDAATQYALAGLLAGVVTWATQSILTRLPGIPLTVDSTTLRKRLVAAMLAGLAGWAQADGEWQRGVTAALTAFVAATAVHTLTSSITVQYRDAQGRFAAPGEGDAK